MSTTLVVFAFDPVDELDGRDGLLGLDVELATRLVNEHRAELVAPHVNDSMRFVAGSTAFLAARDALRAARGRVGVRKVHPTAKRER